MRVITGSDNGLFKVTWLEGRHLLGVWGEQRARHSIDAVHAIFAENDNVDVRAVVLATQPGVVAVVDLAPLDDLDPLRRALNARNDAAAADAEEKAKKAQFLNSATSAAAPQTAAAALPPVPPPQLLPELTRFVVDLPAAPVESIDRSTRSRFGMGGNRPAHSASSGSRFVAVHMLDGLALSRCLSLTDYGRLFVHRRAVGDEGADAWTCADGADGEPGVALFEQLPPLPRGVVAGPSVKGGPMRVGRVRSDNSLLLYAGRSVLPREHDIETGATRWKAMNQPHSASRLEPPVWVTDLALHHGDSRVVSVSAFCDLCIYDPRAQKRALYHSKFREGGALKAVAVAPDDNTYLIADNKGYVSLWDVRQQREIGGLKMGAGAQLSLAYHNVEPPLVATTGLDRFVHVYDRTNRRQLYQFYLKQRMNHVRLSGAAELLKATPPAVSADDKREQLAADTDTTWKSFADDDDEDDVWADLPVVKTIDEDDDEEKEEEEEEEEEVEVVEERPAKSSKPQKQKKPAGKQRAPTSKRRRE